MGGEVYLMRPFLEAQKTPRLSAARGAAGPTLVMADLCDDRRGRFSPREAEFG